MVHNKLLSTVLSREIKPRCRENYDSTKINSVIAAHEQRPTFEVSSSHRLNPITVCPLIVKHSADNILGHALSYVSKSRVSSTIYAARVPYAQALQAPRDKKASSTLPSSDRYVQSYRHYSFSSLGIASLHSSVCAASMSRRRRWLCVRCWFEGEREMSVGYQKH